MWWSTISNHRRSLLFYGGDQFRERYVGSPSYWKSKMDISSAFINGVGTLHHLTNLKLNFCYSLSGLLGVDDFPPNLSYLALIGTGLDEDSVQVLKELPKLCYLRMSIASYHPRLSILKNEFPKLQVLFLQGFSRMFVLHVDDDAMPELRRLEIYKCENLRVRICMSNHSELQFLTDKAPIIPLGTGKASKV